MNRLSDGELLDAWGTGKAEAFSALVTRHESSLLHHARAIVGDGSEDVVQEVFLKLAQNPPVLPEEIKGDADHERAQLSSWLHRVTRNCCMDALRSENRRKRREQEASAREATGGGFETVEGADTAAAVQRGLENLNGDQREVLALRLFGEKSYREIAEITGKKVGTVGWLISEGLKQLAGDLSHLLPASSAEGARG
jgi:RNA polymerase sigma factor (sigma-70 family)